MEMMRECQWGKEKRKESPGRREIMSYLELCSYFLFFCQDRLFFINLREMAVVLAFMS